MAIVKQVRGFVPQIGKGTFLAENAVVVGDVKVGEDCSIWYSAVLRGDVNTIIVKTVSASDSHTSPLPRVKIEVAPKMTATTAHIAARSAL